MGQGLEQEESSVKTVSKANDLRFFNLRVKIIMANKKMSNNNLGHIVSGLKSDLLFCFAAIKRLFASFSLADPQ